MKLPRGRLIRQRVVSDLTTPLARALDTELTGYARLESQDALLLDADGAGVLTFSDGVPTVAYHTGTDRGGRDALSDIAVSGPHRVELYALDAEVLSDAHEAENLLVAPGLPAERLAGDPELADRTREQAPVERCEDTTADSTAAVEEFLEDAETIETIRERAREEAASRADEWGFDVQ